MRAAALRHLKVSRWERDRHQERAARVKSVLNAAGLPAKPSETHIVPVMVGDPEKCKEASDLLLAEHGIYVQPINYLTHHRCVLRSTREGEFDIGRFRIGGRLKSVKVAGRFSTDNTSAAQAAACQGLGIGYGPYWQIRHHLDRGALKLLLEDVEPPRILVHAVFPPSVETDKPFSQGEGSNSRSNLR